MLDDLFEADNAAAARDLIARPLPPPPKPAKFSAWSAIPRGVAVAAGEVGASLSDLAGAAIAFRDTPSKDMARGGLPTAAFSSDLGDSVRDYWRTLKPDPETASTAEQVLFGFSRGLTKLIPATIAAGPAGAIAAGVEEAITVADDLRRQGVPEGARGLAGVIQGTGMASAALPLLGRTMAETAALYVAGGPGGFMAQQALTRKVLEHAGQEKIAGNYDPFDPIGLTVASAIPLVFTAAGLRGQKLRSDAKAQADFIAGPKPSEPTPVAAAVAEAVRAPELSPEVVDAAMVNHLRVADGVAQVRIREHVADVSMGPQQLPRQARHAIEQNLLSEGKLQTRYMGNKREFFQENARFFASDVAPVVKDAETLVDVYAGGGTYGLTMALSGAMPKLKRVVINEVDPVRAERFRLAADRGAEIMRPWDTDPNLVELASALRPLVGKSSTPAALALSSYRGESSSQKYIGLKEMRARHGDLGADSQVAMLALHDVFFSGRTATWDRLMKNAAQDAARIQDLVGRAKAKGVTVDITSHDALGVDAADLVRSIGGNAVVVLDPPYHTTSSGTYSAGGKSYDFGSDDFLAANMASAKAMADGNVIIYNNKDTPHVRSHFASNFGGSMSTRGWKRINGQREFLGVFDGTGKSGTAGLRVGETAEGNGTWLSDVYGSLLDRTGGYTGRSFEADPPSSVQRAGDSPARAEPDPLAKLNEPADAPPKPLAPPIQDALAARVAELDPELVVRVDPEGRHVTLADDLAEVRRLAAEGTDDALGTLDADLLQVAVNCALSSGG